MARALSSWSTAAISARPTRSSSGRSGESLRSIFGSRSPRGWEDDLKTIPSDIELPMRRLGHAPPGFQGFRAETAMSRPFITPVAMFERDLRLARGLARRLAPGRRGDVGALDTDRGAVRRGDPERSRRARVLAPVGLRRR